MPYDDGYSDELTIRCQPRLHLCGGPYDGQVWPWGLSLNEFPQWIILGSGELHEPQREYVYKERVAAITPHLLMGIIYYDYVDISPGARVQRLTLENNQILRATLEELKEEHARRVARLQAQLARYRNKKKR